MYIILNFVIKNFCQKWNFKSNLYFDFYGEKGGIQILKSEVKCHGFIWLIGFKTGWRVYLVLI